MQTHLNSIKQNLHLLFNQTDFENKNDYKVILDTDLKDASLFLETAQTWFDYLNNSNNNNNDNYKNSNRNSNHLKRLHYVAIQENMISLETLQKTAEKYPKYKSIIQTLEKQWWGFSSGFHRFSFHHQSLILTLCVGKYTDIFPELQLKADIIYSDLCDVILLKALARFCQKDSIFISQIDSKSIAASPLLTKAFEQNGFQLMLDEKHAQARFNPQWKPRDKPPILPSFQMNLQNKVRTYAKNFYFLKHTEIKKLMINLVDLS